MPVGAWMDERDILLGLQEPQLGNVAERYSETVDVLKLRSKRDVR